MDPALEMIEAVKSGDDARISELLLRDPTLAGARNPQGESAILMALYRGRMDLVKRFLDVGAELNFHEAAALGDLKRVRRFVIADPAIVNSYSADGFPAVGLASFFGHPGVVEFLIARGADVNAVSRNQMSVRPLHGAVAGRHTVVARLLLAHKADANARQQKGYTPLHTSAQHGHLEMVRLLLSHGADAGASNDDGLTALHFAQERGHTDVADLLRRHNARA